MRGSRYLLFALRFEKKIFSVVRRSSEWEKVRRAVVFQRYRDATKGLQTDAARNYQLVTAEALKETDPAALLALPLDVGAEGGLVHWLPTDVPAVELAARARLRNNFRELEVFEVPTSFSGTSADHRVPTLLERLDNIFNWLESVWTQPAEPGPTSSTPSCKVLRPKRGVAPWLYWSRRDSSLELAAVLGQSRKNRILPFAGCSHVSDRHSAVVLRRRR